MSKVKSLNDTIQQMYDEDDFDNFLLIHIKTEKILHDIFIDALRDFYERTRGNGLNDTIQ